MSEPIPASISIGGRLSKRQVPALCKAIVADGVVVEWGDALFRPLIALDLLEVCQEVNGARVLLLCDDRANWGRFPALEEFLLKRAKLPFDLQTEGRAEFDPELVIFRPGQKPLRLTTSANGQPVVAAQVLTPIADALASAIGSRQKRASMARFRRVLKDLRAHLPPALTPLPSFEII
jgi:hypothetical protein